MTRTPVNESGITVLYEAAQPAVDLVFVHGFTGHPKKTWTYNLTRNERAKKHQRDRESNSVVRPSKIPRIFSWRDSQRGSTFSSFNSRGSLSESLKVQNEKETANNEEQDDGIYWPEDLAPTTFPQARVMAFGYDTKIRHKFIKAGSRNNVHDHARDLLCGLEAKRRRPDERCRPVLFIVHSLGGILVKVALRQAKRYALEQQHLRRYFSIYESTIGCVFFGTPHRGADPRALLRKIVTSTASLLGWEVNGQIVDFLLPNNEQLVELEEDFAIMTPDRKWCIHSFQEELPLAGSLVVEAYSSCLGNPNVETRQSIARNHVDMCRFSGREDSEYQKVEAAIAYILASASLGTLGNDPVNYENESTVEATQDKASRQRSATVSQEQVDEAQSPLPSQSESEEDPESMPANSGGGIDPEVRSRLIEQLYFEKIDERLTSLTAAQKDTCRWFLAKPEFVAWRDLMQLSDRSAFLWIKGNPGTGKSTLMKLLFEKTMKDTKHDPTCITISFFFLARGTTEEKSSIGLYRSLLHQLFEKAEDLKESLEWITPNGARGLAQNGWSEAALKQTLSQVVERLGESSLTIFVDALDECNQDQAADMVGFFEELCELAIEAKVQLRICFSSRHYPTVMIKHGAEITLEKEAGHTEDIERYIKAKLRLGKAKNADSLRGEILEKSSNIFLWVVLVLDIIKREYPNSTVSVSDIRERLRKIPPGLHDLFEMILARDAESIDQLHVCLKWILFAVRPLRPEELYFAVKLGLDQQHATLWDQEDICLDQMKLFVSTASKGLAEVARNRSANVQFIHESVRDFLFGRYGTEWSGRPGTFQDACHSLLQACCIGQVNDPTIYEEIEVPDTPPRNVNAELALKITLKFPFLEYAVDNVLSHANSAQSCSIDQSDFLNRFPLRRWLTLHSCRQKHRTRLYTEEATLLYILAERNLSNLISSYTGTESCFDEGQERYGPPILAARATDSHEAVKAMLSKSRERLQQTELASELWHQFLPGAQYSAFSSYGRSFQYVRRKGFISHVAARGDVMLLLHVLCFHHNTGQQPLNQAQSLTSEGHPTVESQKKVKEPSMSIGTSLNIRDSKSRTPLALAAGAGHEITVRLLLAAGADVNTPNTITRHIGGPVGFTPLSCAAASGHDAIVGLLLDAGASIDSPDDFEEHTALSFAAMNGWQGVAAILLQAGAKPDVCDISSRTPLSYAAEHGSKVIVDLLLQADATPDFGGYYMTPLACAALRGHKAVVLSLLDADACINLAPTHIGARSPLSCAAQSDLGHGVLRLLLDKGASVDLKDGSGRTALSYAASRDSKLAARSLLAKGAEVNERDSRGRTPLSYAASSSHKHMVELLVEHGADHKLIDLQRRSPLFWSAIGSEGSAVSRLATMECLIQKGDDVNSQDADGRTMLSFTVGYGDLAIDFSRLLLQSGATVEDTGSGRPVLAWVSTCHHAVEAEKTVVLLLKYGANINSADRAGRTPVSWAAEKGAKSTLQSLLNHGADVNKPDFSAQSPLWWAQKRMAELEAENLGYPSAWKESEIKNQKEVIELLLSKGLSIDQCGSFPE